MKGSREHKHYVARYFKFLNRIHWDDPAIFKFERCKKKFVRIKKPTEYELKE